MNKLLGKKAEKKVKAVKAVKAKKELTAELHKLGIKTYRKKSTAETFVKRGDVKKVLARLTKEATALISPYHIGKKDEWVYIQILSSEMAKAAFKGTKWTWNQVDDYISRGCKITIWEKDNKRFAELRHPDGSSVYYGVTDDNVDPKKYGIPTIGDSGMF